VLSTKSLLTIKKPLRVIYLAGMKRENVKTSSSIYRIGTPMTKKPGTR